jgi:carboxyl-terminal processing protease
MKGLVIDLRFNPGGLLSTAVQVCDMFISDGVIVSTEGRNVESQEWRAKERGTYQDFEIAVLVNRASASASEIVAACLQDHNRAIVIGERTWGKGSVQHVVELPGGHSALKLTTSSYKRPSGKNIDRGPDAADSDDWGVQPNEGYQVRLREEEMFRVYSGFQERSVISRGGNRDSSAESSAPDRQLAKALEHLTQKIKEKDSHD